MATRPRPLHGRHRLPVVALFALAVLAAGCSEEGSAARLADDAPVLIEPSGTFVTLQNRSGVPLADVTITIVPHGPTQFMRLLSRVENSGKRQVPLSEFRSRDGTPLNLRVVRPKSVRVRAQDVAGKTYELEVPWK
jgi:hypothetical protein